MLGGSLTGDSLTGGSLTGGFSTSSDLAGARPPSPPGEGFGVLGMTGVGFLKLPLAFLEKMLYTIPVPAGVMGNEGSAACGEDATRVSGSGR